MSEWFCQSAGGVQGPLSWNELTYLAKRGKITPRDQVRQGTTGNWVSAKSVPGLLNRQPATQSVREPVAAGGSSAKSSLPTPVGSRRISTAPISAAAPQPAQDEAVTSAFPSSLPPGEIVYRQRPDPREAERNAQQRRVVIASILAGLGLLAALCLLFWMLMSSAGGGAGGGTSSQGGIGKEGEGSQQGEQESVLDNGEDGEAKNEADSTQTGSNAASTNAATTPPHPPFRPSTASPLDATSPNPNGNSRFSIGGSDFFGLSATGNAFIYIVDCSGSMAGERFEKAKRELLRSIYGLDDDKNVFVIFFSDTHYPMFYPLSGQSSALPSNLPNKDRIRQWVENFGDMGGTAPDSALALALQMQPDAIYLLTDGGFADSAIHLAKRKNTRKIPINTIGFQDRGGETGLKQIAADSGGKYKFVP